MANVYRANVLKVEPATGGTLHADTFVELRKGTSPNFTWEVISNGHFTVVLNTDDINGILNNAALTIVQKRGAIRDIIKAKALAQGVDKTDEAYAGILGLITFPDLITIRQ